MIPLPMSWDTFTEQEKAELLDAHEREAAYHSDEPFATRGDGLPEPYVAWTPPADTADHGRAR